MGGDADKQLNHRLAANLNDLTLPLPRTGSFISQVKVFSVGWMKEVGEGAGLHYVIT